MSHLIRTPGTASGANAIGTVSSPDISGTQQLIMVTTKYSATPVQAGVTVTINSGAGAAYDTVLDTGTANLQSSVFLPSAPIYIHADDVIDVSAPAGGGVITSASVVYTRRA
jgi:hypothetical protein